MSKILLRIAFAAVITFGLCSSVSASVGPSFCDPASTPTGCMNAANKACPLLGLTKLDGDGKAIIACLADSGSDCAAGQCFWKSMTSSGGEASSGTVCGYGKMTGSFSGGGLGAYVCSQSLVNSCGGVLSVNRPSPYCDFKCGSGYTLGTTGSGVGTFISFCVKN